MKLHIPLSLGALALCATLASPPARAGAMSVTLTADQFALQTWALQPGATPSHTLRIGAGSHLLSRIGTAASDAAVEDQQESYAWQPFESQVRHGDSVAGASTAPPLGAASVTISMAGNDGAWIHGGGRVYRFSEIILAPQSGLSISGHLHLDFDNGAGPDAFGYALFSSCVRAYSGACDAGFAEMAWLSTHPQGYEEDFSFTMLNPGNQPLSMAWDIVVEASASVPLPVPEPAGWAMLAAGLMLVGARRTLYIARQYC